MKLRLTAALLTAGLTTTAGLLAQDDAAAAAKPDPAKAPATEAGAPDAATPPAAPAPPVLDPAVIKTNSSYGFGYRSGMQFAQQTSRFGLKVEDIDREAFIKGYFEAMTNADPSIKEEDINAALQALGNQLQEREKKEAEANLAEGLKFLEENGKREGVITTESGLQYEIIKKGEGPVYQAPAEGAPPANKQFMVKYKGTLIDGTEFDASPEGQTVPMTLQVIPGFKEAITTMPVGSKWKLFIKPELAYGEQRRGPDIKPNSTLIFELELDNIQDAPAPTQPNFSMPPQGGQPGAARPPQPQRPRPTAVSPPVRVPIPPKPEGGGDTPTEGAK